MNSTLSNNGSNAKSANNINSLKHMYKALWEDFDRYLHGNRNPLVFAAKFFHNPGMLFSILYRAQRYLHLHTAKYMRLLEYICYPLYFFLTYFVCSYHIEPDVEIGGGLFLHNKQIDIASAAHIGKNVSIMGGVTIGTGFDPNHFDIRIGNNVKIGAGAKIIAKKSLHIVSNVTIGANAVVIRDIIKPGVYVGIPVRQVNK